jgi:hypothetical protein
MEETSKPAIIPEDAAGFVAFNVPEEAQEERREEARIVLATLLARHILAQRRATEENRKVA